MARQTVARMFLFVGGLAAAFAWWGFAAQQTLLDPSATRDAAVGLLSTKPVQDSAVNSLAEQLQGLVPANVRQNKLTPAQTRELSHAAAAVALQDPALRRAVGNAIASLQQQLIDGDASRNGLTVDTAAVTQAVHDAVERVDPNVAAELPSKPVKLHFDTSALPSLKGVDQHTGNVTLLAALIALAAWFGAVLVHPEPWTAVRIIGRRAVWIGALPLVFWVLIPAGLRAVHVGAAEVVSPIARAYGGRLAPPAIAIVGIGVALWLVGRFGAASARAARRNTRAPTTRSTARGVTYTRHGDTEPLDRVDIRA